MRMVGSTRALLSVALAVVVTACAGAPAQPPVTQAPTVISTPAAAPQSAPRAAGPALEAAAQAPGPSVTDDLGRQVTIPAKVAHVVSLAPSITEILFAVGAGPEVVGVTKYCDYPPEAQQGREVVGGFSADSISIEKVLALQPDVVFSSGSLQRPVIDALAGAKVPVVALEAKDLQGIFANIRLAGQITGHADEAGKLAQELAGRADAVAAVTAKIPEGERLKVFYEVWDEPLMTAGPNSFIGALIETAGGSNIFADTKEQYPQVSAEAVVERNPDMILGPDSHADGLTVVKVTARPGWKNVTAVRDNRIGIVRADTISRAGPRAIDALETLARLMYPERYK